MEINKAIAQRIADTGALPTPAELSSLAKAPVSSGDSVSLNSAPINDPRLNVPSDQLTPEGRVPVIITSEKNESLFKVSSGLNPATSRITGNLDVIHGISAEVDPKNLISIFQSIPQDVHVYLDGKVTIPEPLPSRRHPGAPTPTGADQPVDPKLDVAIPTLGVDKIWSQGFTGKGIGIAVVDTGIYPHPDLKDRIVAWKDFVYSKGQPYDDYGHGTHVAGDAAGSGAASGGKYKGTAPEAHLIGLKVLDKNGSGRDSVIIKAVQWAIENKNQYNIRVMNFSLGGTVDTSYKSDPLDQALEKAMDSGIIPVIAAGNEGPDAATIGTPGNDPRVLTVGALDDHNTLARSDDTVASFSSRGPTPIDGLAKPDILSPGVNITAPNAPGSTLDKDPFVPHKGKDYITISGTSMATPIMAGIVADILGANPRLTPDQVKKIVQMTADKMQHTDPNAQGAGVVNPQKAVAEALKEYFGGNC